MDYRLASKAPGKVVLSVLQTIYIYSRVIRPGI